MKSLAIGFRRVAHVARKFMYVNVRIELFVITLYNLTDSNVV